MANETDIKDIVRAVEDATTFPLLTQGVGAQTRPVAGGMMPSGTTSFGPLVRNALHEVLQWKPSSTDVKGLKEALRVSFKAQETSGRTVYTHVPRSYIMQVQSDGGAVTGAQASIHTRAKAAVDQSLPLLEGLYPLNTDADTEDLAAVRATIQLSLTGLVEELARPGGPRVQRADNLFEQLLGLGPDDVPPDRFNADEVEGQLGLLRDRLGLAIQRVNNAEEEKNLTNFLILADHVFTLWLSWRSLRDFFDRTGTDVFLGPQLVLLSRSLRVLAESVHETYCALDSVFIGPAEREVIVLEFEDDTPLTLADLLEWVDTFASSEGPQLIQQAGKDGVISFRSTLQQLSDLLDEAVEISRKKSNNPSRGFHSSRVAVALEAVLLHVLAALDLASPLSRLPQPQVTGVRPGTVEDVEDIHLQISGANFDPGATVRLTREDEDDVPAGSVHFVSPTTLFADFNLGGIPEGPWSLVVRNPDGVEDEITLVVENAEPEPEEPPNIRELTHDEIEVGAEGVGMEIEGSNFQEELTITFTGQGVSLASDPVLEGDSRVTFTIDVDDDAVPGSRTVIITNPDTQTDEAEFEIVAKAIGFHVDSVEPNHAAQGEEPVVKVLGDGFEKGMSTNFGPKIRTETIFLSSTELEVHLLVRPEASTGPRTIKVVSNDRKRRAAKVNGFTVDPANP